MNWKTATIVLIACAGSAFGGAWLALNRDLLPPVLGAHEPPEDMPWVKAIVTGVNELEQQNSELKRSLETAQERMTEIETVFVASGLELEDTAEEIAQFRATLEDTHSRLSKMDRGLSSTQEQVEELATDKERKDQQLTLEDFVFIDPNPINGVAGPHLIFSGANVHIQSGGGATDDFGQPTGLGNLFIGYNEAPQVAGAGRFGSHNLVVGPGHSYASYGGFLAGSANTTVAPSATISGGSGNVAAGAGSIICGGEENTVTEAGTFGSIMGGQSNAVSATFGSVVGGDENSASGAYANVTGGRDNRASGEATIAGGGTRNDVNAAFTAIFGGLDQASNREDWAFIGNTDFQQR